MDAELTPDQQDCLAEAGYVPAPAAGTPPVRGRIRVQDAAGHPFDLEVVPLGPATREAWIAHLADWFSVSDPGVEPLVDALDLQDAIGCLTPVAQPSTLETFVETEGRLGAGHTSTVLVTLGRALARLHARGLRYGPMHPRNVLIDAGRALLTVPQPSGTGTTPIAPSVEEDAYYLAALVDAVIAPTHGPLAVDPPEPGLRGLAKVVVSAMGDADDRPGVGTLATLSHDLAPCLPLVPIRAEVPEEVMEPHGESSPRAGRRSAPLPRETRRTLSERSGRWRRGRPTGAEQAARVVRTSASGQAGRADRVARPGRAAGRVASRGDLPNRGDVPSHGELPSRRAAAGRRGVRGPQDDDRRTSEGSRRTRRRTVVIVAVVLTGLLGGGVVHRWTTGAPAVAVPLTEPAAVGRGSRVPVTGEAPEDAAVRLTVARMDRVVALTNAAAPVPGSIDTPDPPDDWGDLLVAGSPAHTQAVDLVESLRGDGALITGLTVDTDGAVLVAEEPGEGSASSTAQVEVTFTIGAYTLESPTGAQTVPASASRTALLDLIHTETGWLVATVQERS